MILASYDNRAVTGNNPDLATHVRSAISYDSTRVSAGSKWQVTPESLQLQFTCLDNGRSLISNNLLSLS